MPGNDRRSGKTHQDDEYVEPMMAEHFDIAVAPLKFQNQATIAAARSVLVDGEKPRDAIARFNVPQPQLSRATTRIESKWREICERENWAYEAVALPPEVMALVRKLQDTTLAPLRKRLEAGKARRARTRAGSTRRNDTT